VEVPVAEPRFPLLGQGRPLIIAELSANHGGNLERALRTVEAAARAGADAIKLQTYRADTLTIDCRRDEFMIKGGLWDGRNLYELYQEAHTPWEWHASLKRAASDAGIPLFSTPFDGSAVAFLEELGVPAYKIASFEIVDLELIAQVAATFRPIIMSTGMATLAEIDEAVRVIRGAWQNVRRLRGVSEEPPLCLLKCVSAYPAAPAEMNLRTIAHLGQAFGAVAGLSDHTLGTGVAVAAVALGARVIEKHFILDRADGGPDSSFSIDPGELTSLVQTVREVSDALGEVKYGPSPGEAGSVKFRRSIFFVRDVVAGEPLSRENVRVIRPGYGLPPASLPLVLGRKAASARPRGAPVRWSDVA
jgi:pseudaminic acid synthase